MLDLERLTGLDLLPGQATHAAVSGEYAGSVLGAELLAPVEKYRFTRAQSSPVSLHPSQALRMSLLEH